MITGEREMTAHCRTPLPPPWRARIRARRTEMGLSQHALAQRIGGGMTQVGISTIERGARDPLVSTLLRILAALGLAVELVEESP